MPWISPQRYLLLFLVSALLSLGLTYLMRPLSHKLGMLDQPNERKLHTAATPVLGGLGVYLAFAISVLLAEGWQLRINALLIGAFLLVVLGIIDDRLDMQARYKLILQTVAAAGLILMGVRFSLPGLPVLGIIITVLWLVGVVNAFNCLDCTDGAVCGLGFIVSLAFFVIALLNGRFSVAVIALALAGSCLGFLRYNYPPASIFLGDAGSTFVGLIVGSLAILVAPQGDMLSALPVGMIILLVPICDIILVHLRRYRDGIKNIRDLLISTGRDHLPHRLLQAGLTPRGVAGAMHISALISGLIGIAASHAGWPWSGLALFGVAACLIPAERLLTNRRAAAEGSPWESPPPSLSPLK